MIVGVCELILCRFWQNNPGKKAFKMSRVRIEKRG